MMLDMQKLHDKVTNNDYSTVIAEGGQQGHFAGYLRWYQSLDTTESLSMLAAMCDIEACTDDLPLELFEGYQQLAALARWRAAIVANHEQSS